MRAAALIRYKNGERGQTYNFTRVFSEGTSQADYFRATAAPMVPLWTLDPPPACNARPSQLQCRHTFAHVGSNGLPGGEGGAPGLCHGVWYLRDYCTCAQSEVFEVPVCSARLGFNGNHSL